MIESVPTQSNNLVYAALRRPSSGSRMQTSQYCEPVTGTQCARSEADDAGADASAASFVCAPLEVSVEDWDDLFHAVEERLRRMVDERNAATAHPGMHDMRGSVRETVLECVAALGQLHAALTHERERVPSTTGF